MTSARGPDDGDDVAGLQDEIAGGLDDRAAAPHAPRRTCGALLREHLLDLGDALADDLRVRSDLKGPHFIRLPRIAKSAERRVRRHAPLRTLCTLSQVDAQQERSEVCARTIADPTVPKIYVIAYAVGMRSSIAFV